MELDFTASLEQIAEQLQPLWVKLFENIVQAATKLIEDLRPFFEKVAEYARILKKEFIKLIPPKWLHLMEHSKKRRVRKKYRDKILRCFSAA